MLKTIVFGAGGHAAVVIDILQSSGQFDVVGCLARNAKPGQLIGDVAVLGDLPDAGGIARRFPKIYGIAAVGANHIRSQIVSEIESSVPQLEWAVAIHASATICSAATIESGAVVAAGCIVGTRSSLGLHTLVNTGSTIDHDNCLMPFASTGPRVATGGNVSLGRRSYVGIGSSIAHGATIGDDTVVGAHSLVLESCSSNSVYYGVPARKIRSRNSDDRYL